MLTKLALLALAAPVAAFDYTLVGAGSIAFTDLETSISPILTLFVDQQAIVTLDGLEWEYSSATNSSTDTIMFETFVDGKLADSGNYLVGDVKRELPSSIDVGTILVPEGGRYTVQVILTLDDFSVDTDTEIEAYGAGVAILPLLVILVLAVWTNMVEFSLFSGIFVGACIVFGNIKDGFTNTIENYILNALADSGHGYVYLFTFFLSGLVAMLERSGGMIAFTKAVSKYATTARSGQAAAFLVGVVVFFDDYANTLLAGQSMRPLLDSLFVSREKLAFFVDATAAPIASISPVSSWVGFEVGLIQSELDRIIELVGSEDIGIKTSGFAVFLESIKYRYYPILMLVLIMILIFSQRDFGPMLIAERKTELYKRTDGGEGSVSGTGAAMGDENQPPADQALHSWNMLFPITLLVFLIFYILVQTGDDGSGKQSFMDKIESSDAYVALLYATMGATLVTLIFYLLQINKDGSLVIPNFTTIKEVFMSEKANEEDPEPKARFLMSVRDSTEAFLIGMARVFPAAIVLTLAWASGSLMKAVGCDRLFAAWITGGIDPEMLPTLSFLISLFMALATGTSWGTMSILFPLVLVPTYQASNGDELIFYSTVAGILSGSVAGDHMSPISDTTVLSSLATECGLMNHVGTQAPYVGVVVIVSILLGTLPIGYDTWPNIVGILLAILVLAVFVYCYCQPIISPTGSWDLITKIYLKATGNNTLEQLQKDCIRVANGEDLSSPDGKQLASPDGKKLEESDDSAETPAGEVEVSA